MGPGPKQLAPRAYGRGSYLREGLEEASWGRMCQLRHDGGRDSLGRGGELPAERGQSDRSSSGRKEAHVGGSVEMAE